MDATIKDGFYVDSETKRSFYVIKGQIPPWVKSKPSDWKRLGEEKAPTLSFTGKTVEAKEMRYDTVGDWNIKKGKDSSSVDVWTADMGNVDFNFLILIHELVEAYLCLKRNISNKEVMDFDKKSVAEDPGHSEKAPYHEEHEFATKIEKLIAQQLKVKWDRYDDKVGDTTEKVEEEIS